MKPYSHKILIGFTQKLCSDGIEAMIEGSGIYTVTGSVPVSMDMLRKYDGKNDIDILIIELNYPATANLNSLVQFKSDNPDIRILLISQQAGADICRKLLEIGIDGYLYKTCTRDDFLAALKKISQGKNYYCSEIIKSIMTTKNNACRDGSDINLTKRETEVLSRLVSGQTNTSIAKELKISESTVKTHRKSILVKFGVSSTIEMIRYACRAKLLDYDPIGFCQGCPHFN